MFGSSSTIRTFATVDLVSRSLIGLYPALLHRRTCPQAVPSP
jgi:hypothetical protein